MIHVCGFGLNKSDQYTFSLLLNLAIHPLPPPHDLSVYISFVRSVSQDFALQASHPTHFKYVGMDTWSFHRLDWAITLQRNQ